MASQVLFISTNRLKRDTAMGGSVEDDLLRPHILMAQTKYIFPVLGTDLNKQIGDLITAGTIGDNANVKYKNLLDDYIIPALTHYSFAVALPFIRVRVANNHVAVMNGEQSNAATIQDQRQLVNASNDIANFHRERLIDFLLYNSSDYPEYSSNSGADFVPRTRNYTQGLNLDPTFTDLNKEVFLTTIGARNAC